MNRNHTPKSIVMTAIIALCIMAISFAGSFTKSEKDTDPSSPCSQQHSSRSVAQDGMHTLQLFAK